MKHLITTTVFALLYLYSWGQSSSIQTDRPDQTESPFTVPYNYFQIESGILYEKTSGIEKTALLPTTLLKYGVSDRFEIRIIGDVVAQKSLSVSSIGLDPITFGLKANLCHERGVFPEISIIGHLKTTKLSSSSLRTTHPAPDFRFTMQHTLSDRFILGYNIGAEWDGESARPTYIYTLTTGASIYKELSGFVEVYGYFPIQGIQDHRIDGGFTYLLNHDLQLDLSAGIGLSKYSPDYFISGGISYRFRCKK